MCARALPNRTFSQPARVEQRNLTATTGVIEGMPAEGGDPCRLAEPGISFFRLHAGARRNLARRHRHEPRVSVPAIVGPRGCSQASTVTPDFRRGFALSAGIACPAVERDADDGRMP
jgi:hypothetical protein